jgi:hypothetical protein
VSALEEALEVTLRVIRTFESLGVRYVVGGSIASSIYGIPRATQDVHVEDLLARAFRDAALAST